MDVQRQLALLVGTGLEAEAAPEVIPGEGMALHELVESRGPSDRRRGRSGCGGDGPVTACEDRDNLVDRHRSGFLQFHGDVLSRESLGDDRTTLVVRRAP